MNNYVSTEKSLKRWLKSRVKITMATVVGFLIAGTVALGADKVEPPVEQPEIKYTEVLECKYGEKDIAKEEVVALLSKVTVRADTPAAILARSGETKYNHGTIYIKTDSVNKTNTPSFIEGMTGLYNTAEGAETSTIINDGDIYVESGDRHHIAGMGANPSVTAINKGKIFVKDGSGMRVNPGVGGAGKTITNDTNGYIEVNGQGVGMLVLAESEGDISVENKGEIKVNSLKVESPEEDGSQKVKAELSNATDLAKRWGMTGVLIETDKLTTPSNTGDETETNPGSVTFKNTGKITAPLGIEYDGYINGDFKGKVSIINEKDIIVDNFIKSQYSTDTTKAWVRNAGIYSASSSSQEQGEVINKGNIKMSLTADQAKVVNDILSKEKHFATNLHGVRLHENTSGVNENGATISAILEGEQAVEGFAAVAVTGGGESGEGELETSFINDGTITAEGIGVHGIYARNKGQSKDTMTIINNGSLKVTGKNAVAVYVDVAESGTKGSLSVLNGENGKIYVGAGAKAFEIKSTSNNLASFNKTLDNKGYITLADTKFTSTDGATFVDGEDGGETDTTTSILLDGNGELINHGTIALEDRTAPFEEGEWDDLVKQIIKNKGTLKNYGIIVDGAGKSLLAGGESFEGGSVEDIVDGKGFEEGIKIDKGDEVTLTGSKDKVIEDSDINVTTDGTLLKLNGTEHAVAMKGVNINVSDSAKVIVNGGTDNTIDGEVILNGTSSLKVNNGAALTFSGSIMEGQVDDGGVKIENNGTLILSDATVDVDITSKKDKSGNDYKGLVETSGNTSIGDIQASTITINNGVTTFGGKIDSASIKIGQSQRDIKIDGKGDFKANSSFTTDNKNGATIEVTGDSVAVFEIDAAGNNALKNSEVKVTVTGNIDFDIDTQTLTKNTTIDLNKEEKNSDKDNNLSGATYVNADKQKDNVYVVEFDNKGNKLSLEYNDELFAEYGEALNEMNNSLQGANDKFSQVKSERANQMDNLYAANIYSETARVALDNVRLSEEAILGMNNDIKAGEWTANGSVIYSNAEHDREGAVNTYTAETESTGLLAAMEYGITDSSAIGFAFSGTKQDVDLGMSSADGDAFYFGLYGRKAVGAYDFTAGLGYQLNKFDVDNGVFGTSADYDSDVFSGYVQGKYNVEVKEGLTLAPKAKLGFAFLEQESVNDSVYKADKQDLSTYNVELGLDLIKTVQLEKGNLDFTAGVSYVRTMGDTDDMTTGAILNQDGSYTGVDVFGAELAENIVKFNFGAEVTRENGFFYNGGFTYKFGTDENSAYGVNAGVGYKF